MNVSPIQPGQERLTHFRLYIAGQSPKSLSAISNLYALCEAYMHGRHEIQIIDLLESPQQAELHKIVAIPTLVRTAPEPVRRLIGDLSNTKKVLFELGIIPERLLPDGPQR